MTLAKRDWQPGTAILMTTGKDRYTNGIHTIRATVHTGYIELTGRIENRFRLTKRINILDMDSHAIETNFLYTLCDMFEELGSKAKEYDDDPMPLY